MESRFFEPSRERKVSLKNRIVQEMRVKLQCSTEDREMTFGSSYREVRKTEGWRNRDSSVVILKHNVLYDIFDCLVKKKEFIA